MAVNNPRLGPASLDGFDWTEDIADSEHVRFFRSRAWKDTPLGPLSSWSTALRFFTYQVLADNRPGCIYWGPQKVAIYNEAFVEAAAGAHPFLMGHGFAEVFPEICKDIFPVFDAAVTTKKAGTVIEMPLMVNRNNFLEETIFTGNFNPLRDDDGRIGGWYNSLAEVTRQIINDRRRKMLNLIPALPKGCTPDQLGTHFIECLQTNPLDIPLALLWSTVTSDPKDCRQLKLVGSIGVPQGHELASLEGCLNNENRIYSLLRDVSYNPITSPTGPEFAGVEWQGFGEPSQHICTVPLSNAGRSYGYLVVGLNPRRPIDQDHEQFMRDLATQLSSTMAYLITKEESDKRQAKLENQLAASEHHIRYMADHLDVGLEHLSMDGNVLWANERYFELIGQEPSATFGRIYLPFNNHVVEEDQPKIRKAWHDVLHGVTTRTTEVRMKRLWTPPVGPPIPATILLSAIPYLDNGQIKSVMACMTEVSRLKWAESWQARAAEEALEAKRQQSEFTDTISHEVRNPLSAMLQLANTIAGSLEESKKQVVDTEDYLTLVQENVEAAKTIIFCAKHQQKILDDVLLLSKMDFMLLSLSPSPVQPLELAENAVKMLQANISAADIDMKIVADDSVATSEHSWAMCDPLRVTQILINLVSNAVKFTRQEQHRCVTLRYGVSKDDPRNSFKEKIKWACSKRQHQDVTLDKEWGDGEQIYLTFSITDTGPGMTEEERCRLFNRFQQASPKTTIKYGGTGLGLYISHTLAEKQNGSMGVASRPGRGSTFAFFVKARKLAKPLTPSSESTIQLTQELVAKQLEAAEASRVVHSTKAQKRPLPMRMQTVVPNRYISQDASALPQVAYHVLVVEDNVLNQRILQKQLVKAGCVVYIANHGLEALETLRRADVWEEAAGDGHQLDVILMDLQMPVMDGLSACREIRSLQKSGKLTRHIEVIAITANVRKEQVDEALDAGIDAVMPKPFLVPDLLKTIKKRLGRREF